MNYRTPLGAFEFWSDAADACERADFDPCACIEYVGAPKAAWEETNRETVGDVTYQYQHSFRVF